MGHLKTPRMRKMYPNGYPREGTRNVCGATDKIKGTTCIIDNDHPGRPHWGPDETGTYQQWGTEQRPYGVLSDTIRR